MIDADTKLVPAWLVGPRDGGSATEFVQDLEGRLASSVQLTTDGHTMYLEAVEDSFGTQVDFAMLQKIYGTAPEAETRYTAPAMAAGVTRRPLEIEDLIGLLSGVEPN